MKRLIKKANVKTIDDFFPNAYTYKFVELGLRKVNVDDIVGMSSPRNEEYNDDYSPKNPDERWDYQMEQVKNGMSIEPIPLIMMPNGKYVANGDGNNVNC